MYRPTFHIEKCLCICVFVKTCSYTCDSTNIYIYIYTHTCTYENIFTHINYKHLQISIFVSITDYVYFENSSSNPYLIRRIEELNKVRLEHVILYSVIIFDTKYHATFFYACWIFLFSFFVLLFICL